MTHTDGAARATDPVDTRRRRCGRCQQTFDERPGAHATAQSDWWVCDTCHVALFGTARNPSPEGEGR